MNKKDLDLIIKLSLMNISIEEQFNLFKEKTNKTRAVFFYNRKLVGLNKKEKVFNCFNKKGLCYFCYNKADLIKHIDNNKANNKNENLVYLCESCYNKLNNLFK